MTRKTVTLPPTTQRALEKMGGNIKKARLRRNLRAEFLAERAGISTDTLSAIEKGVSTVSIGAYAAVLAVLGLDADFQLVAVEEGKEVFWKQNLQRRARATRKKKDRVKEEKSREGEVGK